MKPKSNPFLRLSFLATIVLGAFPAAQKAMAGQSTWLNTGTTDFNTAANWTGGLPSAANYAVFNAAVTNAPTLSADITAYMLGVTANTSFTIGGTGKTLTLSSVGTTLGVNNEALYNGGTGTLTFGSKVNFSGATAYADVNAGGTIIFNDIVSGAATSLILNNGASETGTFIFNGANTFAGALTLTKGTLRATTSTAALGAGTLALSGGTLQLANDTALNFGRNTTIAGNVQITSDTLTSVAGVNHTLGTLSIGGQTLTIAKGSNATGSTAGVTFGATTLTASGAVFTVGTGSNLTLGGVANGSASNGFIGSFTVGGAGNTTISAAITEGTANGSVPSLSLIKSGAGNLTLSAANTYIGLTTIQGGTIALTTGANRIKSGNDLAFTTAAGTLDMQQNQALDNVTISSGASGSSITNSTGTGRVFTVGSITANDSATIGNTNLSLATSATADRFTWSVAAGKTLTLNSTGALARGSTTDRAGDVNIANSGTISSTLSNTSGILGGGWVTYGAAGSNNDWATVSGGNVVALTSYDSIGTPGSNKNVLVTDNGSIAATTSYNTLKIMNTTTAQSLAITAGQILTLASGGLIFTGANDYSITGGTLKSTLGSTNSDLIIYQNGAGKLTIGSTIANGSGATTLTKFGSGPLVLGGTAATTFTGNTYLSGGTLGYSADNTAVKGLFFGLANGDTNVSNLDASAVSVTTTGLTVQTNNATANTISIGSGKTLTVNGNFYMDTVAGGTAKLTISGLGALSVGTGTQTFRVGLTSDEDTTRTYSLDMSGLSGGFTANVANFYIGRNDNNYDFTPSSTVKLAPNSSITATNFEVGGDSANGGAGTANSNTLTFSTGSNNKINATTITIGRAKAGTQTVNFAAGGGTLNFASTTGSGNVTNMYVGYKPHTGSGSDVTGVADFTNGTVTGGIGNLYVGYQTSNGGSGTPNAVGTFTLGASASNNLSVTSLIIGNSGTSESSNHYAVGTVNLNGGSLTAGAITMGGSTTTYGQSNLNINGGTLTVNGDITGSPGTFETLKLAGGTLDMKGHNIGDATNDIDTFTINPATAATLKNVGTINGTAGITMTGAGILTLDGTIGFSTIAISSGTVQIGSGSTTGTLGTGAVTNNSSLVFNRTDSYGASVSNVISGTGSVTLNQGTLTLTGGNTYTGGTNIKSGSIILDVGDNRLSTSGSVVLGDTSTTGKLVIGGTAARSQTLAGLTTTGLGGSVVGGNSSRSNLTLSIASGNNIFGGTLGGGGTNENNLNLIKSGAGTLTLTGANTYTGSTTLNVGTLDIGGSTANGSISSSSAINLNGGDLVLTRTGGITQTLNTVNLNAGDSSVSNNVSGDTLALVSTTRTANQYGTINFTTITGNITTSFTNANSIIGPWATTGSGANTKYAYSNSGTIASLTGTAATTGANLTDTTGAVNYDLAAAYGAVPATVSANTIRYTGAAGTTAPGATSFTVNGLLNAGTGLWTIGTNQITIGSTKELVVNTANSDINISSAIADNGGGTSSLTKTGAGTLTLSGANAYTGVTFINGGTLQIGTGGTSGSLGTGNVTNYAALVFNRSDSSTYSGVISGTGHVTVNSGTVTLNSSAVHSFTGGLNLNGGDLVLDNSNLSTPTNLINSGNALTFGAGSMTVKGNPGASTATSQTFASTTVNAGGSNLLVDPNGGTGTTVALKGLTFNNYGNLLVGEANTANTGTVTITTTTANGVAGSGESGILDRHMLYTSDGGTTVDPAMATGTTPYTIAGNTTYTNTSTGSGGNSNTNCIVGNGAAGSYAFTQAGAQFQILKIAGGQTINLNSSSWMNSGGFLVTGNTASTITGYSTALYGWGTSAANGLPEILIQQYNTAGFSFGMRISGTQYLTKAGPGVLTLINNSSANGNANTGGDYVLEGTLQIGSGFTSALGAAANVVTVYSGAALDVNGVNYATANPLTLNGSGISGNGALINSSATAATYAGLLTLGSDSSIIAGNGNITLSATGTIGGSGYDLTVGGAKNTTISGIIGTGTGGLIKKDAGTLTLGNSANTYTGPTTVTGGTLALPNNVGSGINSGSTLTVASGAIFQDLYTTGRNLTFAGLAGAGTFTAGKSTNGFIVGANGTLSPGDAGVSNGIGTMNISVGALTLPNTATTTIDLGASGTRAVPGTSDRVTVAGTLALGGGALSLNNATGTASGGSYKIFTYTGTNAGTVFATINNLSGTHAKVVDDTTGKNVYLDVYNLASAVTTQTVNVGAFHVGVAKTVALTLNNTAPTNATYTETLSSGAFSGTTANFTTAGSVSGIAGGGSGSGTLLVGVGTGLGSGIKTGSTVLALNSDAVNSSGLGTTGLTAQTITLNATGYNLASAATTQTVNVGNMHVGGTKTAAVTLNNTAPTDATYTETLSSGVFSGTTANFTTAGSVSGIIGGGNGSGTLLVGLGSGLAAGAVSGTTVLALNSNAVNGSGLGTTALSAQTITITGGVYNLANAATTQTVNVGNYHVGVGATGTATIGNTAPVNATYTETLSSNGFGSTTTGFTTSGSFTGITAGGASGTVTVGIGSGLTGSGSKSGTTTLALNSNAVNSSGLGTTAISSDVITITGVGYNLASAATTQTVNVGNMHVGGTKTAAVTLSNTASVDATYTETLSSNGFSGTTTNFTATGSASGIAGGGNGSGTLLVGLGSGLSAGLASGTTTLALNSNAVNGSGLGTTSLTGQTITITGQVYSGAMIWNGASGGSFNDNSMWNDSASASVHVAPGLDGSFAGVDTATFGGTSGSVAVNLNGASPSLNAITFNGSGSYTISGSGNLTLAGTSPSITSSGTQVISSDLSLSSNLSATVSSGTLTLSGNLSTGGYTIQKSGAGTLILSGTNSYTGQTDVTNGELNFSNVGALNSSSGITLANGTSLVYSGATGSLTPGVTVTTGGTGTIQNTGSGALTLGALSKDGSVLVLQGGTGGIIISGVISGPSANSDLVIDGGTTTLTNVETYVGPTYIKNGGTLKMSGSGLLPATTALVLDSTGTGTSTFQILASSGNQTVASLTGASSSTVDIDNKHLTVGDSASTIYAGKIIGGSTSELIKQGSGTLTLTGDSSVSPNNFKGATRIEGGVLSISSRENLGDIGSSKHIYISGGATLQTTDTITFNTRIFDLGTGGGQFDVASGKTLTTGATTGYITGTGNDLTKKGPGTMVILGTGNNYSGDTNVTDGKLIVNGNISTSLLTTVSSGATLSGTGTTGSALIQGGATLEPGNGGIGILHTGDLTLAVSSISNFEIQTGSLSDLAASSAFLTFGGILNVSNVGAPLVMNDTFNLFDWNTATGTFSTVNLPSLDPGLNWNTGNLYIDGTITVVPEPDVSTLIGGIGMLLLLRRRR